ncbi:MAG: hypothetical protein ACPGJS_13330 [Flammeovirgaceae bacterium]
MAAKKSSKTINELEKELKQVKQNLNDLKAKTPTSSKRGQSRRSNTSSSRTVRKQPERQKEHLLMQIKQNRIQAFELVKSDLLAARDSRIAEMHAFKEMTEKSRVERLYWINNLQKTVEDNLQSFIEHFESQCEKDRQHRLEHLGYIQESVSQLLKRTA